MDAVNRNEITSPIRLKDNQNGKFDMEPNIENHNNNNIICFENDIPNGFDDIDLSFILFSCTNDV